MPKYRANESRVKLDWLCRVQPHIRIVDHGIGIPQADLPHVFEPFFRAKNTRSIKGHGVGLALSKAIIEKMGGKVSVHSIEGEGTTLDIKV